MIILSQMETTSLYFHIPFCIRRCGYCDFNTFAGMIPYLSKYVDALCQELTFFSQKNNAQIKIGTIFFGGGTPSLLTPDLFREILKITSKCFDLRQLNEVTIEANPGTVDADYLKELREIGINRISFGMQSAHPDDLRMLYRQHQHEDMIRAVKWSKQAGFDHINLDLIFGIPGQSLERWMETLELALLESIDHFSLYSLSIEEGTPLKKWVDRGVVSAPDEDLAADMYEAALDRLDQAGFMQYEISNWARLGDHDNRCQHNLQYWRYLPYLGFGAGAHGFFNGIRTENVGGILDYIQGINAWSTDANLEVTGWKESIRLSVWDQMQEYLMVGFRLTEEGVSKVDFKKRFNQSMEILFARQLEVLTKRGLIEIHPGDRNRLRLTKKGRFFGNQVFSQFVGNRKPAGLK